MHQDGEERWINGFWIWHGLAPTDLNASETADLGFSCTASIGFTANYRNKNVSISSELQFSAQKCLVSRGCRGITGHNWDDSHQLRYAVDYHSYLEQISFSSRISHRMPRLSANNKKLKLQFALIKLDKRRLEKPGLVNFGKNFDKNCMKAWHGRYFIGMLWAPCDQLSNNLPMCCCWPC